MKSPQATFALLIATCVAPLAAAQEAQRTEPSRTHAAAQPNGAPDLARGVYLASIDVDNHTLRRYAGQELFNTQGAALGTIKDFIVHPASSRIRYFVVSSGGFLGGIGNSLRLVPFEAVRPGTRGNLFEVDILEAAWLQVPPVSDDDYVADRFNISPAQHQAMLRQFGGGQQPMPGADSQTPLAGLVRASVIRGKAVHAENRKVGDIENIVLDLQRGLAAALIDSSGDYTGTTAKYVVPLNRLTLQHALQDPIGTTLTRTDFDRARPVSFGVPDNTAATARPATAEPPLEPTGRVTAPAPAADPLAGAVRAIRDAINNDRALVGEQVQVLPENGRVVLRGSVRNESIRRNLEQAARRAAPSVGIENEIVVASR